MTVINFQSLGDERGQLVSLESNKNVPFDVKRAYYIHDVKSDKPRGFHAHKELLQVAVCITGKCRMILDNGFEKVDHELDSSTKGVLIDRMVWHEMHDFTDDCVLLVLASDYYDESDYIRDYNEFLEVVANDS